MFKEAISRDVDFHNIYPQDIYLDLETGDILYVYESDSDAYLVGFPKDENKKNRQEISRNPENFLKICGLSHGQQHEILKNFIRTYAKSEKEGGYFRSIGGWKKTVDEATWEEFEKYQENEYCKIIEKFMAEKGIEPDWY
jgi:hypothetical protein